MLKFRDIRIITSKPSIDLHETGSQHLCVFSS